MSEQETEDLARVAYAAYAESQGITTLWGEGVHKRVRDCMRAVADAVRDAVLAQVAPPEGKTEPACVHSWHAVDYWRDLGSLTLYCTHCAAVERKEVPKA